MPLGALNFEEPWGFNSNPGEAVEITNQVKINYLQRYSTLTLETKRALAEVDYWMELHSKAASFLTDAVMKKIRNVVSDLYQRAIYLQSVCNALQGSISAVEDERYQQLLKYRYIGGLTFEQIAEKMFYCPRYILRLHKKALEGITLLDAK
ncbi:MAG: hypothetical protein PHT79_06645 [Syntrophomonadaceae bacterium]|nr:hypothetical protein [Syntrophomonadaceae bacterium]MDD3897953.1 hypothetical protein [Syntrophomonadaceae bacterium]MDD4549422.1 hypothetical protein [Syntrophomonadaceae bacterium]